MKANRYEVFNAINGERDYQDLHTLQDDPGDPDFSTGDYIAMLLHYAGKLPTEWAMEPGEAPTGVLANMRKIAAIAVQCMEVHGVVSREEEGRGQWGDRSTKERT